MKAYWLIKIILNIIELFKKIIVKILDYNWSNTFNINKYMLLFINFLIFLICNKIKIKLHFLLLKGYIK